MAKARVQLRHCETYTGLSGETWKKNQSRVLTNQKQIAYYKAHSEFVVTTMQESKSASAKPAMDSGDGSGDDGDNASEKVTKARLERMSKAELVDYAAETFGLALDEDEMKKGDLVAAVLEAQG